MYDLKKTNCYLQEEIFKKFIIPITKKYPELNWFADQEVAATSEGTVTNEYYEQSWTKQLQNHNLILNSRNIFIELERTLHSLVCFNLLQEGSIEGYNYWVQKQQFAALSKTSFNQLHQIIKQYAPSIEDLKAIEASLIYSDLGKTKIFKQKATEQNITLTDHDDLILALCKASPEVQEKIIPSFANLETTVKEQFLNIHIYMPLQWGNILQLEGGPKMFTELLTIVKKLNQDPTCNIDLIKLLHQCFIINISDIAGAMAHIVPLGSGTVNENTYIGLQNVLQVITQLIKEQDPQKTIENLIAIKQQQLGYDQEAIKSTMHPEKLFILTRIATMLRFYSKQNGIDLLNHFNSNLNEKDWNLIQRIFGLNSGINTWNRNPTYMPAVLLNLFNSKKSILEKYSLMLNGVIILAKISEQYEKLGGIENSDPLSFNYVANQAKEDPELFYIPENIKINLEDFNEIKLHSPSSLNRTAKLFLG